MRIGPAGGRPLSPSSHQHDDRESGTALRALAGWRPGRWRPLAKDGTDLPVARQVMRAARQPVSIGETADVELIPESPGDQRLQAFLPDGSLLGTLSVHVTKSEAKSQ